MIGITAWAPLRFESKAEILRKTLLSLDQARGLDGGPTSELLIVDNDCKNPSTRKVIDDAKTFRYTSVFRFSPQVGWPKSRNFMIEKFMQSDCDRLVMMDQDIEILDPTWLRQIADLHTREPDLHAYHIIFTKRFWNGTGILKKTKRPAEIADRFLGGCNVISREVPLKIGGYNPNVSTESGIFADTEFGWRLRHSRLLNGYAGQFLDPFKCDILHNNSNEESEDALLFKEESFDLGVDNYLRRYNQITQGVDLFCDYKLSEIPEMI